MLKSFNSFSTSFQRAKSAIIRKTAIFFFTVSFCFAEKRVAFICETSRALCKLFFRRVRDKTKPLIDRKKGIYKGN